jgi:hypothetical protein
MLLMPKIIIKQKHQEVFNKFKNHKKTEGFELKQIHEIYLPFWQCKQTIVADKTVELDRFSKIILSTIHAGVTSHAEICAFLGVKEDDFVTMQFHYLIKNGLITIKEDCYTLTRDGINFLNRKLKIQQLEVVDFEYFFNDLTKSYFNPLEPIDKTLHRNKKSRFSGYKVLQTHKLLSDTIEMDHKNRPRFHKIKQTEFAVLFNKEYNMMSFYDFENQEIVAYKRAILFLCLEYVTANNEKEYDIRQFKKTVEKFDGYSLEETLSKTVTAAIKHKPEFFE